MDVVVHRIASISFWSNMHLEVIYRLIDELLVVTPVRLY